MVVKNAQKNPCLAHPTTYKKLDSGPTQAIRNDVISTVIYFLHSFYRVFHRTRNHLVAQKNSTFKIYTPYLPPSYPNVLMPLFSMDSQKSVYSNPAFPIPPPTNINMLIVIAPPASSQTMSYTSCNLLQKHTRRTSATATISYSLNYFHLVLTIPIKATFSLLFHGPCTPYPISVLNIPPSCHETDQADFDSSPSQ